MTDPRAQTLIDSNTRDELRDRAVDLGIDGAKSMTKEDLAAAIVGVDPAAGDPAAAPSPPDVVGRPPLADVAEQRAAEREKRLVRIGNDNPDNPQED